ncbi:endo-1,4-beta-xylanase [Roseateles sp.]|uniref:endo-1,4-beta-xylanase n=1 Tax=Roseateles sp. TaxID=1971397 RepID=UPI003BA452D3
MSICLLGWRRWAGLARIGMLAAGLLAGLGGAQAVAALEVPGELLLNGGLSALKPFGPQEGAPQLKTVAVDAQAFDSAMQMDSYGAALGKNKFGLAADLKTPLHKGDVLWISFKARSLASLRETGESFVEVKLDQLVNGKSTWPAFVERGVSIGKDWTETSFAFVMRKDASPADMRFVINFDHYPQRFELGPVRLINYGPGVQLSELPRTVIRYDGDAPDAAWRSQAAERIERLRKGDMEVQVVDAKGRPVKGAEVSLRMKRHAFNWGTAVQSSWILDQHSADAEKYREVLSKYFNQAVYENELKTKYWEPTRGAGAKRANVWLRERGFNIRAHVMVWPSWRQTPPLAAFKEQPEALRAKILGDIATQTSALRNEFDQWDVLNEPFANHNVQDMLGYAEEVAWFKAAREGAPGVKLFLNDYTLFQGKGEGSPSQAFFNNVKRLKEQGAPIDAVGEQGHIGGTPPSIDYVLERLDFMGSLGLPIQITEFDINSTDDEFKARYLDDFMTAVFSHPSTIGFVQWGFWAGLHWFPHAALWDENWNLRAHGKTYIERVTKTWWTDVELRSNSAGQVRQRGFLGDYEVTVRLRGKTVSKTVSLQAGQAMRLKVKI